ncbi:MFS transporter [Roseibacterium sp. SDUM158016]|uniref:MFS transporter n=1 Tax=Roseicyclus sediminis TaxID=2980997 RepID=UPI0021D39C28|nr:MFS transporter [Roseibacterium sp. SDUM158016]MCU4654784.1 MFS transporter [Roseibacterium sp. SDUM158016]
MPEQPEPGVNSTGAGRPRLPAAIWVLGFVSMLMDISSEMIHALLPVYLTVGLGATALAVGVIEGIAEATASITKVFSGALSDRIGRRKELAALGYGLAAITKPVFPLAPSIGWLVAARFVDRVGKGIRGAPRDALVADLAPAELRGAAFGLRQSLDTVGAFLGPLAAIGLMWLFANDFQSVFWVAVLPAFLAFALILFAVREPVRPAGLRRVRNPLSREELRLLGAGFWWVVAVAAVFTLARFSEAFLILRAGDAGLPIALAPLVLVGMNAVYAGSVWPVGIVSDRVGRTGLMAIGLVFLILADLFLAFSGGLAGVAAGVLLWGLHMGFTQGLLSTLVAEAVPAELRGTAFGVFNLVTGAALLCSSVIAGALWDGVGPSFTFLGGAAFASLALLGLWRLPGRGGRGRAGAGGGQADAG